MEKILDANDKAIDEGFADAMDRLINSHKRGGRINGDFAMWAWEGKTTENNPVSAFVERGRWIALCECGSAEWVAEGVPMFCRNCGNANDEGAGRVVNFPANKNAIEAELMTRKIHTRGGRKPTEQVLMAVPDNLNLGREWRPGETVEDLQRQKQIVMDQLEAGA